MGKRRTTTEAKKLGRAYAAELRLRAELMRSCFMLTRVARELIARDLEALAYIADKRPECFRHRKHLTRPPESESNTAAPTPSTAVGPPKGIRHEGRAKGRQGRDGSRRR